MSFHSSQLHSSYLFLQGGTLVSINGDNFRKLPGARCIFGNQTVSLTFIS